MESRLRGDNHSDTRERNRRLVLRALTTYGPLSRRQISELSGLVPGTISGLVNHLIEEGILITAGTDRPAVSRGGPSQQLLDFNPKGVAALGIALGVYGRIVSLYGPRGEMLGDDISIDYSRRPSIEDQIDWIATTSQRLIAESGIPASAVVGAGVGAEGVVNAQIGEESFVPYGGWEQLPVSQELERRLGMPVIVANACHVEAAGEVWFGQGRTVDQLLYVSIGTTIGATAVIQQEVQRGYRQLAGAIGHVVVDPNGVECVCGKRGCLETIAGAWAVRMAGQAAVRAKQSPRMTELCAGNPDMLTAEFVAQAACEGDPAAVEIVLVAASALGKVLAPLVTALGPEMIILQGEIPRCGSTGFRDAIRAEIEAIGYSAPGAAPLIAQTELPFSTTALGAAALALDHFFFSPQLVTRGKSSPTAALL
jgi:predicted NBD/HSP70 family sugar kinase